MTDKRKKFTSSTWESYLEKFDKLAKDTRLQKSVLMDEALNDLFAKYNKKIENYK